ncbi:site-specific integrase [bacterium AH-315-C07]|nr:site-specific integrase [bacterium AH-315-C07]
MKVTFVLLYNRKKKLNHRGEAAIEIRAYYNGKIKIISSKIYVTPHQWDDENRIVNHSNKIHLNLQLQSQINALEKIQTTHIVAGKAFNLKTLNTILSGEISQSFSKFIQTEIKSNKAVCDRTITAHQNMLNKLDDFRSDITFDEINYNLIQQFDYFLKAKGLAINTVDNNHKNLLVYINLSIKKGLFEEKNNPYKHFKRTKENIQKEALTECDVDKLEKLKFHPLERHLEIIRDMFLFSCYTGLRISDVLRLNSDYIFQNGEGWVIDNMKSKKSHKDIYIPLEKLFPDEKGESKAIAIIERYYTNDKEPFFNKLSEAYINRRLKEIAHLANIDKRVTFHIGRNTFATTLAQKLPTPLLQKLLQHSNIQTTMVYVNLSKVMIKEGLDNVRW